MKKALLVGLTKYPNCELNWCDNDAIAMKELLEANGDGSPNFEIMLETDSCTYDSLLMKIERLFADDADIALFYFSGHGSEKDGGYLCTTDYCDIDSYGVKMSDVLKIANNSRCKNKIIILDCCFAANMGISLLDSNTSLLGDGVTIIAASQTWQKSLEDSKIEHGVFTNLVIQGLKGGAADIAGKITPASVYAFVDQSLGAWEQRPVFKTNISQFLPIRTIQPKVSNTVLRKLSKYFKNPTDEFKLDPSYEYTNSPDIEHEVVEPYADPANVIVFKELQLFQSVGLVEPVDEEYMYFAAMKSKGCKLTALGLHYWKLSKDRRF